jgi:lipopolysaccharide biosynthesis glycosyltransferase
MVKITTFKKFTIFTHLMGEKTRSILLVADNNYIKPLVAQINSLHRNLGKDNIRIYLVHQLSNKNLSLISNHIYAHERFKSEEWKNVNAGGGGHVTRTNMGKFQAEFIKEPYFMYLDTDAVVNRPFKFEYPETMTCDGGLEDLVSDKPYAESMRLMIDFIRKNGGFIEEGNKFMLFCDGVYFAKKEWVSEVLKPKIKYCSEYMPQAEKHWTGMGFFQAAIGLLQRPIRLFEIKELIPLFETVANLKGYDVIHYIGPQKPWDFDQKEFPLCAGEVWWDYYTNGPIKPLERS